MTCKLYHVFVDAPLETLSPNQGKMGCTPNSVAMAFIVFIYIAMYIQLSPDQMSQCWILCGNHLVYRRQPANLLKQICPEWFPALKSYRKLQLKNPIFFGHPKPNPTTPQAFGRVQPGVAWSKSGVELYNEGMPCSSKALSIPSFSTSCFRQSEDNTMRASVFWTMNLDPSEVWNVTGFFSTLGTCKILRQLFFIIRFVHKTRKKKGGFHAKEWNFKK